MFACACCLHVFCFYAVSLVRACVCVFVFPSPCPPPVSLVLCVEYKFLMNNKAELSEAELLTLLQNNELTHYDPVAEAFKIYDPADTGFIDLDVFREILANLGFGDITEQDVQTLVDTADCDGDGRVSLSDFRRMLPSANDGATNAAGGGMAAVAGAVGAGKGAAGKK